MIAMTPIQPLPLWAAAVLAVCALTACSPDAGPVWFPLKAGDVTRYEVRYSPEAAHDDEVWTLRTRGPVTWQGNTYMLRHHSQGVAYFFEANEQGVLRVALQTDMDREPQADASPMWVLKAPYQVDTEWTTPTVPYLLMRKNEHPRELKHSQNHHDLAHRLGQ